VPVLRTNRHDRRVSHIWNAERCAFGGDLGCINSWKQIPLSKEVMWVSVVSSFGCWSANVARCWMRNSSAWLAEVVRMPKSSVYIQLSNGGFIAVAGYFKVLGSLYGIRICWLLFVCIYSCVRLVRSTFCAFCKRRLQRWMSAVFCVQLLKGETLFLSVPMSF